METVIALIFTIAVEMGLPPNFVLAIALTENDTLNPMAIHHNADGTEDKGIMQLNSSWFRHNEWYNPEINIRAGCSHIKTLLNRKEIKTYWLAAVAYNAGLGKIHSPPKSAVNYAHRVMKKYTELNGKVAESLSANENKRLRRSDRRS